MVRRRGLLLAAVAAVFTVATVGFAAPTDAATTITVSPAVNVSDAQTVTVNVSGFTDGAGGITECSTANGQPTVAVLGKQVPVSCSNPLNAVQTVSGGSFYGKQFSVRAGTVGPPASGVDSAGRDAAGDAALYPCPPSPAQTAGGATCVIAFGNATGEQAQVSITFLKTPNPAVGVPTTIQPNPGPAATSVTAGTISTPTTVATAVLGEQVSSPAAASESGQPPLGQVARTGPNDYLAPLSVAGLVVLDLGYLFLSSSRAARRRRLEGVVPGA